MSELQGVITYAAAHGKGFKVDDGENWINSKKPLGLKKGDKVTLHLDDEGLIESYDKEGGKTFAKGSNGAAGPGKSSFQRSEFRQKTDPEEAKRISRSHAVTAATSIIGQGEKLETYINLASRIAHWTETGNMPPLHGRPEPKKTTNGAAKKKSAETLDDESSAFEDLEF